jgi:hypothetical protein
VRSTRPREFRITDLGQLRVASRVRPVQHFIIHQFDRSIDDCDE